MTAAFLLESPEGMANGHELWTVAKAMGCTPREALEHPDLPFTLTCLRSHQAWKRERLLARLEALPDRMKKDPLTHILLRVQELIDEA